MSAVPCPAPRCSDAMPTPATPRVDTDRPPKKCPIGTWMRPPTSAPRSRSERTFAWPAISNHGSAPSRGKPKPWDRTSARRGSSSGAAGP